MTRIPWRHITAMSLVASGLTGGIVVAKALQSQNPGLALIAAGKAGPSFRLIAQDFPTAVREADDGPGHDGQMIYAMARLPTRVEEAAPLLDRPRYRLQRPLFPWVAGILHPWGGGQGLVAVIFMLGVAALFVGGVACGVLAHSLGGRAEIAFLFPVLGGCFASLRIGVGDAMATALVITALALLFNMRSGAATAAGIAPS